MIDIMFKIDPYGKRYHCIYCPPYMEDYRAAKHFYTHSNGKYMADAHTMSKEQYLSHIEHIREFFPDKLMLLLQQNNYLMDDAMLQDYINLGFSKFCVGSIEQAQHIRAILPNAEIIASITMKLMPEDLENPECEVFDGIVLYFPYNRDLEMIANLPKKFKYILLVNCGCNINCPGTHHWFADRGTEKKMFNFCPNARIKHENDGGNVPWEQIIRIRPMDLPIFDPYITYYKLQGREFDTSQIVEEICLYSYDYLRLPRVNIEPSLYYK